MEKKPLRICLVSSVYPPRIGGPSIQTYYLAQALIKKNVIPVIVTFGERTDRIIADGIEVHYVKGYEGTGYLFRWLKHVAFFFRLLSLFRVGRFDVMHIQTGTGYLIIVASLVARLTGTPVFLKFSGDLVLEKVNRRQFVPHSRDEIYTLSAKARVLSLVQKANFWLADLIWAPDGFMYDRLTKVFGVSHTKVIKFPNLQNLRRSIEADLHRNKTTRILSVIRFVGWKNVSGLVQVFYHVRNCDGISWVIVGDGEPEVVEGTKRLVESLGLDGQVHFVGKVSPLEIWKYYQQCDIFLHSTYRGWFSGAVFIEAVSVGLPVVALNIGDILDKEAFEEAPYLSGQSVEETAGKLKQLINDSALREIPPGWARVCEKI